MVTAPYITPPSPAERHILLLYAQGYEGPEIAAIRGTAFSTVRSQTKEIRERWGVSTMTQAVYEAMRRGWLDVTDTED